ncbi:Transcriptional regulatory protein sin3 [Pleurotus pulmonarius]|nr:Transcriptional regulatory protein sin3 [Pleurotus pulmonarius]KAF4588553.1 Transcriptional regulatory protein sin3 [Pleurotus pulmonarius]
MTPSLTQDAANAPAQMPTVFGSLNGSVNAGGPAAASSAVNPAETSSIDVSGALAYLDSIRDQYRDRAAVYNEFLDIMREFKQGRADRLDVVRRISRLLLESPQHIEGFSAFLPPSVELQISRSDPDRPIINLISTDPNSTVQSLPIALSDEETTRLAVALRGQSSIVAQHAAQQQGPEFMDAITFLDRVRARYGREDNSLYRAFLELMQRQQRGELTLDEMSLEVEVLFRNAPDLWDDFQAFLPTLRANAILATA